MVENLEYLLRSLGGESMIQRRHRVLEQHREGVYERSEQVHSATVVQSPRDEHGNGRDGKQHSETMRDGVGHLLARRVLAHAVLRCGTR